VPAVGFVNERQLEVADERKGPCCSAQPVGSKRDDAWNHTYSHPDFNRLTVAVFEEQIEKGDIVTRQLMQSRRPYQLYFRHPMTHTGDTVEKKEAIEKFLAARGYKVTRTRSRIPISSSTSPYVQAVQNGDTALAKRRA
jgi:hypothetical protein